MEVLPGHDGPVFALCFSPRDGALLSGGKDGALHLWTPMGEHIELSRGPAALHSLACSSDGRWLAVGNAEGQIELWDMSGPTVQSRFRANGRVVSALTFAPDDATVAFALSGEALTPKLPPGVHFWDWRDGKTRTPPVNVATLTSVRSIAASREKRLLAWATESRTLEVWPMLLSDRLTLPLKSACRAMALSPDGKTLAAAMDWKVNLFDIQQKRERLSLAGHKGVVAAVAFSPDGRLLMSGSWDNAIRIWDAESGRELASFDFQVGRVCAAVFAADGLRAAVAGDEGRIVVLDVDL